MDKEIKNELKELIGEVGEFVQVEIDGKMYFIDNLGEGVVRMGGCSK